MLTVLNPVEYYANHSSILLCGIKVFWGQKLFDFSRRWRVSDFALIPWGLHMNTVPWVWCTVVCNNASYAYLVFMFTICVMVFVCPISASSDTFQSKNAQPFTTKLVFHEMFWLQFPHQDGFSQVCMWLVQTFLYLNGGESGTGIFSSAYTLKCLKWLNKD